MLYAAAQGDLPTDCAGAIQTVDFSRTGTAVYTATEMTAGGTDTVGFTLLVDATCGSALAGTTVTINAASCLALQSYLGTLDGVTESSCSVSGDSCACSMTKVSDWGGTTKAYTTSGTTYSTTDSTASYCVDGTTLTVAEDIDSCDGCVAYYTGSKN